MELPLTKKLKLTLRQHSTDSITIDTSNEKSC